MVSRTHHYGIVQDGFTALKAPSLCPPCSHPRWLWGVPVMWSIPQDASWRHGDLPSCPAHSPLHPPIPWSPQDLPPSPQALLQPEKQKTHGLGCRTLETCPSGRHVPQDKVCSETLHSGCHGPRCTQPRGPRPFTPAGNQPQRPLGPRVSALVRSHFPQGDSCPWARFWLSAWVCGGRTCRAPHCVQKGPLAMSNSPAHLPYQVGAPE